RVAGGLSLQGGEPEDLPPVCPQDEIDEPVAHGAYPVEEDDGVLERARPRGPGRRHGRLLRATRHDVSPCQICTTRARSRRRLADDVVGSHHLVLFMLHDVAVEDVPESVAAIYGSARRQVELRDYSRHLSRERLYRVLASGTVDRAHASVRDTAFINSTAARTRAMGAICT